MNAQEERAELMAIAEKLHLQLREFTQAVHLTVNKLIEQSDKLIMPAMDEKQAGEKPTVKLVKFNAVASGAAPVTTTPVAVGRGTGKRACSICREPGHRSTSCPQADKKFKADRKKK